MGTIVWVTLFGYPSLGNSGLGSYLPSDVTDFTTFYQLTVFGNPKTLSNTLSMERDLAS